MGSTTAARRVAYLIDTDYTSSVWPDTFHKFLLESRIGYRGQSVLYH